MVRIFTTAELQYFTDAELHKLAEQLRAQLQNCGQDNVHIRQSLANIQIELMQRAYAPKGPGF